MKICVAQTRPIKGDIAANLIAHKQLIDLAVSFKVDAIFFPELSVTGYEPTLAKDLATNQEDNRWLSQYCGVKCSDSYILPLLRCRLLAAINLLPTLQLDGR